jgi:hypothetical protein
LKFYKKEAREDYYFKKTTHIPVPQNFSSPEFELKGGTNLILLFLGGGAKMHENVIFSFSSH